MHILIATWAHIIVKLWNPICCKIQKTYLFISSRVPPVHTPKALPEISVYLERTLKTVRFTQLHWRDLMFWRRNILFWNVCLYKSIRGGSCFRLGKALRRGCTQNAGTTSPRLPPRVVSFFWYHLGPYLPLFIRQFLLSCLSPGKQ
jgi:hypothetical protein